jgi:hypothetical protein
VDLAELGRRLTDEPPIPPTPVGELRRRLVRRRMRRVGLGAAAVATAVIVTIASTAETSGRATKLQIVGPSPSAGGSSPVPTPPTTLTPTSVSTNPVSTVPAEVRVPNVVGMTWSEATSIIGSVSLGATPRFEYSSTIPAGTVLAESPAAGSLVSVATPLFVIVSRGPVAVAGTRACRASDLRSSPASLVSEATGQHTNDWQFTNVSGSPCVIEGYPTVTLFDATGHLLPFRYKHSGDQMTTASPPTKVDLPPGSAAWLRLNRYRCDLASTATATTAQVSVPGGGTLRLSVEEPYCAQPESLLVAVSPFEPVEELLFPNYP